MRALVILAFLPLFLVGCEAFQRAGKAATTPAPSLDGKTPVQVLVPGLADLACAIAQSVATASPVPAVKTATEKGPGMYEAIALIVTALFSAGGGAAYQSRRQKKKLLAAAPARPTTQPA